MENKSSLRSQMSFLVSMLLHAGAIVLIIVGPNFLGKKGTDVANDKPTTLEVSVTAPAPAAAAPVVAKAMPKVVAPAVIAVKKTAKVKVAHKSEALPEKAAIAEETKSEVEPQPVVVAANTETPLEKNSDEVVAEKQVVEKQTVEKEVEEQAVVETAVAATATDEAFATEKPTPVHNEQPPVAKPAEKVAEPLPPPAIKSQANPEQIAAASAASGVAVVQSYTGLKQVPGNKPPSYSREMRMKNMRGAGQMVYYVNKDGSVSQIQLIKSTGSPVLDQAAVDAFSKYKFVPGQEGFTVHNFEFSLKGPAMTEPGRLRTAIK